MGESFAGWLKRRREAEGLTKKQAADLAGISPKQWGRLERGECRCHDHTLGLIALALTADLKEVCKAAGRQVSPAMLDGQAKAYDERMFNRDVRKLSLDKDSVFCLMGILEARRKYFANLMRGGSEPGRTDEAPATYHVSKAVSILLAAPPVRRMQLLRALPETLLSRQDALDLVRDLIHAWLDEAQRKELAKWLSNKPGEIN